MSGFSKESVTIAMEWAVVLSFGLAIAASMIAEALWLKRKGWAGAGGSFAFSILTNVAGFTIGLFVVFVVFAGFMMMAIGGSIEKYPLNNAGLWITIVLALVSTPVFLMLFKRFFLFV